MANDTRQPATPHDSARIANRDERTRPVQLFVSYNSLDAEFVKPIAKWLADRQVSVWIDRVSLVPGDSWDDLIKEAIADADVAVVFLGPHGHGPVQERELVALIRRTATGALRVIPVILPGAGDAHFLVSEYTWVDFNSGTQEENLDDLYRGIVGESEPRQRRRAPLPQWLQDSSEKFAGRDEELVALHELLTSESEVGITQEVAAYGFGGVGKSSVARAYARRYRSHYPGGVFLVACDQKKPQDGLLELAEQLGIEISANEERRARQQVTTILHSNPRSLLILDNIQDRPQWIAWERFLPKGNCRCLVTTREKTALVDKPRLKIDSLTVEDGRKLLAQHRADAADPSNRDAVDGVIRYLDGWAVALTVCGVYMSMRESFPWPTFADALANNRLHTLVNAETRIGGLLSNYDKPVDQLLDGIVQELDAASLTALYYSALFPADEIVADWIEELVNSDAEIDDSSSIGPSGGEAVWELERQSLLRSSGSDMRSLHRVLRHRLLEQQGLQVHENGTYTPRPEPEARCLHDEDFSKLFERLLEFVLLRSPQFKDGISPQAGDGTAPLVTRLAPMVYIADAARECGHVEYSLRIANDLYDSLRDLNRHQDCLRLLEPATEFVGPQPADGPHVDTDVVAEALSKLAVTESDQFIQMQDEAAIQKAVRIGRAAIDVALLRHGADDGFLAMRYSNFAMILQRAGRPDEALDFIVHALEIDKRTKTVDHPHLVYRYSILSYIHLDLGSPEQARECMREALRIDRVHCSEDSFAIARDLKNLGTAEAAAGNRIEARRCFEDSLRILRQHVSEEHGYVTLVNRQLGLLDEIDLRAGDGEL